MARDISQRLTRLATRRSGMDRLSRLSFDAQMAVIANSLGTEAWQKRATTAQPNTRYALGAMQEVGPDSTRISLETAERVRNQLEKGLTAAGLSVEFRLQGSVPSNTHIRGVSDVDLLNLDTSFFIYAPYGALAGTYYAAAPGRNSITVLTDLRTQAEKILKSKFPEATVDCSGGKAINISGGSLARPVDVVPSHWYNTAEYQRTLSETERGVVILDRKVPETHDNWPFKHIALIGDRDTLSYGGLKKAIRLAKNVKSDAEADGTKITLPSFDIAAAMYHADLVTLQAGALYELAILAETQRHLDWLTRNESEAQKLRVPDGSRPIFNTPEKLRGLRALSVEMDDLMTEVAREQDSRLRSSPGQFSDSRAVLSKSYIPAV